MCDQALHIFAMKSISAEANPKQKPHSANRMGLKNEERLVILTIKSEGDHPNLPDVDAIRKAA